MKENLTRSQIRAKIRWGVFGIFILLIVASAFDAPVFFNRAIDKVNAVSNLGLPRMPEKSFNLGLDLQGGAHLVYQADVSQIDANERGAAVEGVRDVIERRVNALGVSEPIVQTTKVGDSYRIIVELPGVTDINQAIQMIGETPILEFKEQNNEPLRELTAEEKKGLEDFNKSAKKKAGEALKKAKAGLDFAGLVKDYSDDVVSKNNAGYLNFISKNSPYFDLFDWAEKAKDSEISKDLVDSYEGLNVLKRGAERDGQEEVKANHILICYLGAKNCDTPVYTKEKAKEKAQELYNQANAENFFQLAKDNSTDPGSKDSGGDLGWFGKGMMVKEFEEAVFGAQVGQIVGPVETQFGFHIIYKQDKRISKEYELWRVLVKIKKETDILPPQEEWKATGLSGKQLERSEVVSDPQTGVVQVSLSFDSEGKDLFAAITERNVGKPVAIFLDGQPISIPNVNEPIRDGRAVISGAFSLQEAKVLSQRLNAGALPVPVELISQQSVGATLGAESLTKSLKAGLVGTFIVVIFMILYYRLPGLLAAIALLVYAVLTMAISKLIGVTLTLSGIAGVIMSIGMAVDANVLIFERMKEELRLGKSLKAATEEGFLRAWPSIRDSNLSTLITCVMLIWFGTSFVQGFAVTLTVGILVSMFTAITITRTMMRFIVPWFAEKANWLFLGHQKNI
ncbi:MAG: protein-export membrane protein SecD [Candidatus Magasanikbacteria bacterium RIFCSPLOWO2_01_FULL_43_20b]|uniref:Protein translocase subunit SecD n=1 Tax=Candidatus Magasanikbacteria bacterium RIFCSPLOWO2_12_FULL_43_12 TaxID=1798692 RepID=A0A1F6MVN5_9BACT|nr:MAG: protein-export membrane protein SecD [Candidatus Magasanikbacteria bacterium RIFCSPLOWO2_02_FULL_43_22]OGH71618.1 MAG: protein-export membrane protein SecD [Candidatus Magasanikbacteria bacterium RIFCSPHIGHO2_02_FULL_44_13]OGH73637.1 MAG: protein-export membrane protein SecD [Candidatus Magasanikbacteria bacterium RIFCSPLOWO2_01_FULL_43_20b]OGH75776.1 MAG: protein-export membrane protein SecD [Candidatus Magasanikbacteria bacterium RIFCSPLOWO2_12_FULL_43_12]